MENISPEERLFNAIEQGNSEVSKKAEQKAEDRENTVIKFKKAPVAYFRKIYAAISRKSFTDINMEMANKVLIGIVGALIVFLIVDFVREKERINKVYEKISVLPAVQLKKKTVSLLEPLSMYLNVTAERDIFNPVAAKPVERVIVEDRPALSELTKDFRLVGIYWGEVPEAMIEDTTESKTYFLKIGQTIKGIKVNAILEDRIILEYNNETMEFM